MNKLNATCKADDHSSQLFISCHLHGKKIGYASVAFYDDSVTYPTTGITMPAKTAVYGATEVNARYRGHGLGTEMLRIAEQKSLERGMKRLQVPSVLDHHFFIKNGFYYTGRQRIFEKQLPEKPFTAQQQKQTQKYLSLFKDYKGRIAYGKNES